MSAATTGEAAWLDRIEQARRTWEEIVSEAGDAGMDRPGAAGEWTFKDVAGHLNGWRELTVDRLEAVARDEAPPPMPWPDDLNYETDEGVEAINRWIHARNRNRPAADILTESRAVRSDAGCGRGDLRGEPGDARPLPMVGRGAAQRGPRRILRPPPRGARTGAPHLVGGFTLIAPGLVNRDGELEAQALRFTVR